MHIPSRVLGQNDSFIEVWLAPPPEILDPDHLMRIVNRRTKVMLPPVTLPQKIRLMLMRDKEHEDEGRWIEEPQGRQPICGWIFSPRNERTQSRACGPITGTYVALAQADIRPLST